MIKNTKIWVLLVFVVGLVIYFPTFNAGYNIDDEYVTNNSVVSKGFAAFGEIFTEKYVVSNEYAYGYRPITKITYAIEHQFFGENAFLSHLINLIIYLVSVFLLYQILVEKLNFKKEVAQLTALLFLIHPVHTEVVCSLKNREELLVLLWFFGFINQVWKYLDSKKILHFLFILVFLALGVLTKLTAVIYLPFAVVMLWYAEKFQIKVPNIETKSAKYSTIIWKPAFSFLIILSGIFLVVKTQTEWRNKDILQALSVVIPALIFYYQNKAEKQFFGTNKILIGLGFLLFLSSFFVKGNTRFWLYGLGIALPFTLYFLLNGLKKILPAVYLNLEKNKWPISLFSLLGLLFYLGFLGYQNIFEPDRGMALFSQNPLYLNAYFGLKFSTLINTLWFYLKILVFPKQLLFYYGYNMLPESNYLDFNFVFKAISILLFLAFSIFYSLKNKAFALGFFLFFIGVFPFLNLVFPVAGIVGERLIYLASIGFFIMVSIWFYTLILNLSKNLRQVFLGVLVLVFIWMGAKTNLRSQQWESRATLFYNDLKFLSNSVRANAIYANEILVNNELQKLEKVSGDEQKKYNLVTKHYEKAVAIDSTFFNGWNNLGSLYFEVYGNANLAEMAFKKCIQLNPNKVDYYYNLGSIYEQTNQFEQALQTYQIAIQNVGEEAELLFAIAYCAFEAKQYDLANKYIKQYFAFNNSNANAFELAGFISKNLNEFEQSQKYFEKAISLNPQKAYLKNEL